MYKQVDKFVCTFFWYAELTKIQKPSRPAKIYKPKQFISIALWFKIKPLHKYRKRFERDNSNNKLTRIFHSRKRVSVFAKKQPANTPFCLDLRAWMHTCGFHTWLKWKLQLFRLKCVSSLCSGHATVFQRWSAIRTLSHSSSVWWGFKSPCCHTFASPPLHVDTLPNVVTSEKIRPKRATVRSLALVFAVLHKPWIVLCHVALWNCWSSVLGFQVSIIVTGSCSHSRVSKQSKVVCPRWAVTSWSGKHHRSFCTWLWVHRSCCVVLLDWWSSWKNLQFFGKFCVEFLDFSCLDCGCGPATSSLFSGFCLRHSIVLLQVPHWVEGASRQWRSQVHLALSISLFLDSEGDPPSSQILIHLPLHRQLHSKLQGHCSKKLL